MECHEIWHYDDDWQCQTLTGLIALCPSCHEVKHMGFSGLRGKKDEAVAHLALVNGWSLQGAFDYVDEAFDVWRERSRHAWKLDISWLAAQGLKLRDERAAEGNKISFRWSLRFRLSRRRALRCPPSWNKKAFPAMWGKSRRTTLYPAHRSYDQRSGQSARGCSTG
ncbi:hypothetical protein ACR9GP_25420 [Enterobacter ludwigii]